MEVHVPPGDGSGHAAATHEQKLAGSAEVPQRLALHCQDADRPVMEQLGGLQGDVHSRNVTQRAPGLAGFRVRACSRIECVEAEQPSTEGNMTNALVTGLTAAAEASFIPGNWDIVWTAVILLGGLLIAAGILLTVGCIVLGILPRPPRLPFSGRARRS